ncbi:MAG TPA: DUF488 domain-containing protein [Nocardioidaceae bacterium]|nr:DUF488 domain-containing protein [Nocardioidaceae bacterium]
MLLTVGHGRLERAELASLLHGAGVQQVVDVRRFPGSRSNADVRREAMDVWLPETGIGYRWEERLGGRRRLEGEPVDTWWRVEQFAAYAAHTRTAEFGAAVDLLLAAVDDENVAVMCSESLWWRCHRRQIADVAVLAHGVPVSHLMHDGRLTDHRPAAGARVDVRGQVVWDAV